MQIKMFLLKRYSKETDAKLSLKILQSLKKSIFHHEYIADNPFLYSTNPIQSCLLIVEYMREIRSKFKSMIVKTMEIEEFVMKKVFVYINALRDEQTIQYLLLENDLEGRDCLALASSLEFYKFLENENVQEIIITIWRSQFRVEGHLWEGSSALAMVCSERLASKKDFEKKYRFYTREARDLKQHDFQFHIWKHSVVSKFYLEATFFVTFLILMIYYKSLLAQKYSNFDTIFSHKTIEARFKKAI